MQDTRITPWDERTNMAIANPALLIAGIVVFVIGVWLWRWSQRHTVDLQGAALSAGWQGLRKGRLDLPDDLKSRFNDIASETSNTRRAAKAGGTVVRHFMAQVVWLIGLGAMVGGLALSAAGIFWN